MGNLQISRHMWVITGENKSKFPSGNAIFIQTQNFRVIIDTNPGYWAITNFLQQRCHLRVEQITDILLTHAHLDHTKSLGRIFEPSQAHLWGLPDTLNRCEDSRRIGTYAGVPPDMIQHFVNFGQEVGFTTRSYPQSLKNPISPNQQIAFDDVVLKPHVSDAHALQILDLEIIDGDVRCIFSQDYDFTPIPWYGVPQRGACIPEFIQESKQIVAKQPDFIISSHREAPIPRNLQTEEFNQFANIITARTDRAVHNLSKVGTATLSELPEFIYPISRMVGKYSEDYIKLGQIWDSWMLLAHLEDAWRGEKVECVDAGGDPFLSKCIEQGGYRPDLVHDYLVQKWCEMTLKVRPPFKVPLESQWKVKK